MCAPDECRSPPREAVNRLGLMTQCKETTLIRSNVLSSRPHVISPHLRFSIPVSSSYHLTCSPSCRKKMLFMVSSHKYFLLHFLYSLVIHFLTARDTFHTYDVGVTAMV